LAKRVPPRSSAGICALGHPHPARTGACWAAPAAALARHRPPEHAVVCDAAGSRAAVLSLRGRTSRRARTGREGTRPRPRTLPRTPMVLCPRLRLLATAVPQVPLLHRPAYNGAGRALSCVVLLPPFLGSNTPPKVPRRSQSDERMSDSRCRCAPYLATFGLILACLRRLATIRCSYRWMSSPEQLEP
jgi:hypothetical protein